MATYLLCGDERDLLGDAISDNGNTLVGARADKGVGRGGQQVGLQGKLAEWVEMKWGKKLNAAGVRLISSKMVT